MYAALICYNAIYIETFSLKNIHTDTHSLTHGTLYIKHSIVAHYGCVCFPMSNESQLSHWSIRHQAAKTLSLHVFLRTAIFMLPTSTGT